MVTRRIFFGALGGAAFANAWDRAAFPAWSDSFVDKVLTDSPWAKQPTVPFRFRPLLGGTRDGVATEIYLTVRWASALPVRQAMAILQSGQRSLQNPDVIDSLRQEPEEHILEVAGFPVNMIPQGARRFEAELADSCALLVKGRRHVVPSAASVPEHGNHLIATVRFPKLQNLNDSEGFIELSAQTSTLAFAQKFRLRDMIYRGKLEL